MSEPLRFPYLAGDPRLPDSSLMPFLPLTLLREDDSLSAVGLLDTGATVNVLPYSVGRGLGLIWEEQRTAVALSGNLARQPARGVVVSARIGSLESVRLAFAWTQSDDVPLLLGQANFFLESDVCFFRARGEFEIVRRQGG